MGGDPRSLCGLTIHSGPVVTGSDPEAADSGCVVSAQGPVRPGRSTPDTQARRSLHRTFSIPYGPKEAVPIVRLLTAQEYKPA
jgi:hypothetical protein